jgi:hypothetical protein
MQAVLTQTTITNNQASYGAGIFNYGTLQLSQTSISGNSTTAGNQQAILNGGALLNSGTATIDHSTISNNQMTPSGSFNTITGGGIINFNNGILYLNHSTVSGNRGSDVGGGIFNYGTDTLTLTITNSTISDNEALIGGGINNQSWLSLNNSTISGNSASAGGGIYNYANPSPIPSASPRATAHLQHSTIVGNNATGSMGGGGIGSANDLTLLRTIITGNSAPMRPTHTEISNFGTGTISANSSHNVVGYGGSSRSTGFTTGATDVIPTGALSSVLNPTLANNGGPTLTHALVLGSPAIDLIPLDGSVCILNTSTDQRGAVRGSGTNRGDGACDAGAFEFSSNQTPLAVTNLHTQTNTPNQATLLPLLATLLTLLSGALLWLRRRTN